MGYGNNLSMIIEKDDMVNPLSIDIVDIGSVVITLKDNNQIETSVTHTLWNQEEGKIDAENNRTNSTMDG